MVNREALLFINTVLMRAEVIEASTYERMTGVIFKKYS